MSHLHLNSSSMHDSIFSDDLIDMLSEAWDEDELEPLDTEEVMSDFEPDDLTMMLNEIDPKMLRPETNQGDDKMMTCGERRARAMEGTPDMRQTRSLNSPPRKKVRYDSALTQSQHQHFFTKPSKETSGLTPNDFNRQHKEMLSNLFFSMKRSEISRAQVVKLRKNSQSSNVVSIQTPEFYTMSDLSKSFFSGYRATLTSALEDSRRLLQLYFMSQHIFDTNK